MKSIFYIGILGAIAIAMTAAIFGIVPTAAQMSDNATMGNMTGGNMTGGNMTGGNMTNSTESGSISGIGGVF
jgi:hypothetical protein